MSVLSKPYFRNEKAAFAHLEAILWKDGISCPHCGSVSERHYDLRKTRIGLRKCADCRKQFTVKVGTVFESAHIPLHKMLQAVYLLCSSKKGISAHQLHRVLGITYKSAWFLAHRIREAMRSGKLAPMGGNGKIIEADETFYGKLEGQEQRLGTPSTYKNTIFSLVERDGNVRSFHVADTTMGSLLPVIHVNVAKETAMMTDEHASYQNLSHSFASHETVNHSAKEYARYEGDLTISTNTVEGYFSLFKRGMKGIYQHCKEKHLHRYLAEFDFRYNHRIALGIDDETRGRSALKSIVGKRLTYAGPA
jgi:transposase-like protein